MSSNNLFPTMSGPISPEQMCGDVNNNILVSTDWYTPVPYTYDQPYLTPFPSSTVEPQQWNQYARSSIPDINMVTYPMAQPTNMFHAPIQNAPGRPRSSPSTFGPSPENLDWTPSAGLGIQYTTAAGQPTPLTSTFPPSAFPAYGSIFPSDIASPPQLQQPQPRRPYQSIAPNPAGVTILKRQREEDGAAAAFAADESRPPSGNKRRRTVSSAADISDDDRLLLLLREGERLPWKEIAARFTEDKQEDYTTARLQMKYKRLREKFRDWEEVDTNALKLACEYFEKTKWQLIAAKMGDFGVTERWSPRYCEHKWRELSSTSTTMAVTTSSMQQFSSPLETPMAFVGMPYQ